ncbi:MAG TPA: gephyrin-like molybdotransferase Glp [Thermomicrobiales bacterium]|jgi:molybdenum cofactor synthesis domain-containing protein|nr:gephyrin-like molybdotransferase Glp [Thermomicrobiales bacterium]
MQPPPGDHVHANTDIDRMLPPAEASAIIAHHVPKVSVQTVDVGQSAGRVIATDIVAPHDHPGWPASTMDGFAVLAADLSPWREIVGTQNAGDVIDAEVTEGYTVRIMTGAPVPHGADAVVPVEDTELMEDHVVIHRDVKPGENIRQPGSDIRAGELVIPAGTRLGFAEVGLLASLGITPVTVARKPKVSIISTGDELKDPHEPIDPGQIRDANRFALAATLADEPVEITWIGKAPDDRVGLETLLKERMKNDDIILTSGGVSMGEKDYIKAILFEADDVDLHFRRLFMKPGKPLNFATRGETMIFGLPGNPVSSLVTFELFIRPAIRQMIGDRQIHRPTVPVRLLEETQPSDRIEYQRAIVSLDEEGRLVGRSTGMQRSSRLASFLGANAFLVIPPREIPWSAGETVEAMMLGAPLASDAS